MGDRPVEISKVGQIQIEHIKINESFNEFIKIITPIFKENKGHCTIIKPDIFDVSDFVELMRLNVFNDFKIRF